MRLDHALTKIGVQIVRHHSPGPQSSTLMLRVPKGALPLWSRIVEDFLTAAETIPSGQVAWTADVSRVYFLDKETKLVRYLWRVVLSGNCAGGAETLGMLAIRALSSTVELTSQPLVGRVEYSGTKGAHSMAEAARVVAQSFSGGGGS